MKSFKQYHGITRSEFGRVKIDAQKEGIRFPEGDVGVVEYSGIVISFEYSDRTMTLSASIEKKPLWIPESLIWQFLDSARLSSVASPAKP